MIEPIKVKVKRIGRYCDLCKRPFAIARIRKVGDKWICNPCREKRGKK